MCDHRYRFGKTGKYLAWNYERPRKREKRTFPKNGCRLNTVVYVTEYFRLNSHLGFHS